MSECCAETHCNTGYLPSSLTGIAFIAENRPFSASGDCCDVLCSGRLSAGTSAHSGVDPRTNSVEYVSIDDGAGGFIESVSGCKGLKAYPGCTGYDGECCPIRPPVEPGCQCYSWTQGGSHRITCAGGRPCNTYTWAPAWCEPCCAEATAGQTCCDVCYYSTCVSPTCNSFTPVCSESCCLESSYYNCYCCYSGFVPACNPFEWNEETCRFTGKLYNNDTGCSDFVAEAYIYFDDCTAQWIIKTDWSGSNQQWANGQTFYADCDNCSGLDRCKTNPLLGDLRYGTYSPKSGPASAAVCVEQTYCGDPTLKTSGKYKPTTDTAQFYGCY